MSISDSDKHFASAITEYVKRLGGDVTLTNIKPVKNGSHEQIIAAETQVLIDQINKRSVATYLLSKEGKSLTTEQFAKLVPKHDHHLCFIIWWPYGINETIILPHIQGRLSFGQITMPHGLAKLVLIEQIYRIGQISQGRQYHY